MISLLQSVLSADAAARRSGELSLAQAAKQSGFGVALVQTILQPQYPEGVRQMAAVLLKRHVKEHWAEESKHFQQPVVSNDEKAAIRTHLLQGLADPLPKLRTAVSMAVSAIAKWDLPDAWPGLLNLLMKAVTSKANQDLVDGGVRCLSLFADELGEEQVMQAVPVLLPELLSIVSNHKQYRPDIRRRAFVIVHSIINMLSNLSGQELKQVHSMLAPLLPPWFEQFGHVLGSSTDVQDVSTWGIKLEALKLVQTFVQFFSKLVGPYLPPLMAQAWQLFVGSQPVYQHLVINNAPDLDADQADEEGDNMDFESLMSQLFEVLITLVGNQRHHHLMQPIVPELIYLTIGYMQMTQEQVEEWSSNPDQYVADEEEETFSVRVSGELVLDELMAAFPEPAVAAVAAAVNTRLQEAAQAKASGDSEWWRLREAALLAVGAVAKPILEVQAQQAQPALDIPALLHNVLHQDLIAPNAPPFLTGRALWMAARLSEAVSPEDTAPFLQAAAGGLSPGQAPAVQIGACRAIVHLCQRASGPTLQPHLPQIYQGLGGLLQGSGEDTLHLVLESLATVIRGDTEGGAPWEAHISPCVIQLWARHITDPMLAMEAGGVIEALAAGPAFPTLLARILPILASIISHAGQNSSILVEGALDVLVSLAKPARPEQAQQMQALVGPHIQALMLHHHDSGILQSCCQYLKTLIVIAGVDMLSWGGANPQDTLQGLLQVVSRLLQPDMGDSSSLYVGGLIHQLLLKMPAQVGPIVPALLAPLVAKLADSDSSPLVVHLLLVLAQLALINTNQLVDCLAAQPAPGGRGNALEAVMGIWIERQLEFVGRYRINLATTALVQLLASRHPALMTLQVKGQRIDVNSKIRTRARAKQQAEQWQMVPLPAKLIAMLADSVSESQQSQKAAGHKATTLYNETSEEWADEDDDDDDDDDSASFSGNYLGLDLEDIMSAPGDKDEHSDDPLSHLDLDGYIAQHLRTIHTSDPAGFEGLCASLTMHQLQTVKAMFS
ncbi:hypothetical protein WJX82_005781 [Trebouxia sp. C0006]